MDWDRYDWNMGCDTVMEKDTTQSNADFYENNTAQIQVDFIYIRD